MQLDIKIDKKLPADLLRDVVDSRSRFALTRLSHELITVAVVLERETEREGGMVRCRVTGTLRRGGGLDAQVTDTKAATALSRCLARFRRLMVRRMTRSHSASRTRSPRLPGSAPLAASAVSG